MYKMKYAIQVLEDHAVQLLKECSGIDDPELKHETAKKIKDLIDAMAFLEDVEEYKFSSIVHYLMSSPPTQH